MMKKLLLIVLIACVQNLSATDFTVSNTNDAGAGSLRQSILNANADGSATAGNPHVINFTTGGGVFITSALPVISNHITINGSSSGSEIIRIPISFFRVLEVNGAFSVELNRLHMQNGDPGAAGVSGGALLNSGGNLSLNDCVIEGNRTSAPVGAHGGAINNISGNISINNSTIKSNTANNANGGAVHVNGGTVTLINTTVQNNNCTAGGNGGALATNTGATLNLVNCTVIGNYVDGSTGFSSGGLLLSSASILNMTNTILANNNNLFVPADYVVLGAPIVLTNNNNIVENCLSTSCAIFSSNADPLLSPVTPCGAQDVYRPSAGSFAIDGGTILGAPSSDICGTAWINLPDIGSVESVLPATALDFDGINDYVEMGSNLNPSTSNFTVELWLKLELTPTGIEDIIVQRAGTGTDQTFLSVTSTNQIMSQLGGVTTMGGTITPGNWEHVALIWDGANLVININGIPTTSNPITMIPSNGNFILGQSVLGMQNLDAQLDELRIWNINRCQSELTNSQFCELVGNENSLIQYYNFNQGAAGGSNPTEVSLIDTQTNIGPQAGTLNNFALVGPSSNWIDGSANGVSGTCTTLALPEIDITGNGASIVSGDTTPALADHTEFGNIDVSTGSLIRTFTIDNSNGTAPLTFLGPGVISSNTTDFTLGSVPPATVVAGGSTTFTVTFDPTSIGLKTSTITIATNDCNEGFYSFLIQGSGCGNTDISRGDTLEFDDLDDYISIPDHAAFDVSAVTLETWVFWTNSGSAVDYISAKAFEELEIHTGGAAGNNSIRFIPTSGVYLDAPAGSFTSNEWNHVACVYNPSGAFGEIYINGIATGAISTGAPLNTPMITSASEFKLGSRSPLTLPFAGELDEFRLWNVVRSPDEIRENMHLTLSGCESGLAAYFQMNDGTNSSVLSDKSANANHGTLMNMDPATAWIASGVNVGNDMLGLSNSQTINAIPIGASTQNFSAANLSINYTAHSEIEDVTVTYQAFPPNTTSGVIGTTIIDNPMWTINKSSVTSTQTANMTFTIPSGFLTTTDPGVVGVFVRVAGRRGVWASVGTASSLTPTTVTFDDVILTGQFMIAENIAPEIDVLGNATSITDGDITPDIADDTDYGNISATGNDVHTFTIDNSAGAADLNITSVIVSGAHAADFVVSGFTSGAISAGNFANMMLTFTPGAIGLRTATITINSDDLDEAVYDFSVQGTGICLIADQTVTVSPTSGVCSANAVVSLTASELGLTYWLRDNGDNSIVDGPVAGTGSQIDFNSENISATKTYNVLATKGAALDFDGTDDFLTVPADLSLDFTGDFTIEAIIKESGSALAAIYSQYEVAQKRIELQVIGTNQLQLVLSGDGVTNDYWITSDDPIDTNAWNHVAAVYEAGVGVTLYINGDVAPSTANGVIPTALFATSSITTIGASRQGLGSPNFYTGQIEELRVWNDIRTLSEIQDNVINTLTGAEANLVANWSFEDGIGNTTALDKTANNNTATLSANMDAATDWVSGLFGTCELIMTNTPTVTITNPEMDVQGLLVSITSGDTTPDVLDDTNFGTVIFGAFEEHTFTIENTGDTILDLTGLPLVNVTGSTDFTVTVDPATSIAASGGTTTFTVRYTPAAAGTINTATLSIANTDCDENPYTFDITGTSVGPILVDTIVYLQGAALSPNTGEETLMRDDLRVAGLIPTTSPYADAALALPSVFNLGGTSGTGLIQDDIVDWIWVELRDEFINTTVLEGQSALLQRDGDIVAVDGLSSLSFMQLAGNYNITVKHRNHLGVMTASPIALTDITTSVDFSNAVAQITFGTNAQSTFGMQTGVVGMWAGNANGDILLNYQGASNDTNTIKDNVLADAGTANNLHSYTAYDTADVDMDGTIIYQGANNDSNRIKDVILSHPDNGTASNLFVITEQLPEN